MFRLRALIASLLALLALLAFPASAQQKLVSILATGSEQTAEVIRDGIRDGMKAPGLAEGKTLRIQFFNAGDDDDTLRRAARKFVIDRSDVIIGIGREAARAAADATRQIPVVFVGVDDPFEAGLVTSLAASGTNVTGVLGQLSAARQIELIRQLVPGARRIGVLYGAGQASSIREIRSLQDAGAKTAAVVLDVAVARPIDVGSAARSLIGKVDVLFTLVDPVVTRSFAAVVKVANDARIPLIATEPAGATVGATATFFVSNRDLGLQSGRMALRILRGVRISGIAPEIVSRPQFIINPVAAGRQGVTLSESVLKNATQVLK